MKLGLYRTQSASSAMENTHLFLPDGPAYLMAYLEDKLGFTNAYVEYDIKRLLEPKPDIIGLSAVTESINQVYDLAAKIKKEHNIPIVIGGPHTTYLPEALPRTIDVGVMGEGEETFREIMELALVRELVPEKLKDISGIVYWDENGTLQKTPSRPLIQNIDDIPLPKRHIDKSYHPVYQNVFTSRGCPYKCTYCIETRFWTRTRFHSAERVVSEIEAILRDFPEQTSIAMGDTIFAMNKKRLRRIAELIREGGYHKKIYFGCNARANIFDEEVCEILKSMNVRQINFGFESGSDKILDYLKGAVKAHQNEKALELCEKYGFYALGHIIIGAPIETVEDSALSYWFLNRNQDRLWRASIHPMTPFPGSFIWSYTKEKKLIDENFTDWENFNLSHVPSVFMNEHYTPYEYIQMGVWFDEYQLKKQQADNYLIHYTNRDLYFDLIYQKIKAALRHEPGLKTLEVSDLPAKLADFLEADITRVEPVGGQLSLTGLTEGSFEQIVIVHSLEKLRQPVHDLQNLKKLLKPAGKIFCVFYNAFNKEFIRMLLERGGIVPFVWGPGHSKNIRMLSFQQVENMFRVSEYNDFEILQKNMNPSPDSAYTSLFKPFVSFDEKELDVTSYIVTAVNQGSIKST